MISIGTPHGTAAPGLMSIITMEIVVTMEAIALVLITAIGVRGAFRMVAEVSRALLGTRTLTLGSQKI